jgi:two-component system response regulator (stage 0 sporulation protein A)
MEAKQKTMETEAIRILIADDNPVFSAQLLRELDAVEGFEVVGEARDGMDALQKVQLLLPDLLLLDPIMPRLDGLGVLDKLHEYHLEKVPRVIVLAGKGQDAIAVQTISRGADCYLIKPFEMKALILRIQDLMSEQGCNMARIHYEHRDWLVVSLLHQVGVPPKTDGYRYLREAINLVSVDISLMRGVTTRLYPALARTFATTPSRVERSIRHAIETTANKGNIDTLYAIFGGIVDPQRGKPTNSEFISQMATYVRMGTNAEMTGEAGLAARKRV